jgi:hypothetical protein
MFAPKIDGLGFAARRIAIAEIDRAVAGRLGPTRILGNAQPAVFNRQVAMYLAKALGGWSVTKIGKFYNGRPRSTPQNRPYVITSKPANGSQPGHEIVVPFCGQFEQVFSSSPGHATLAPDQREGVRCQ